MSTPRRPRFAVFCHFLPKRAVLFRGKMASATAKPQNKSQMASLKRHKQLEKRKKAQKTAEKTQKCVKTMERSQKHKRSPKGAQNNNKKSASPRQNIATKAYTLSKEQKTLQNLTRKHIIKRGRKNTRLTNRISY